MSPAVTLSTPSPTSPTPLRVSPTGTLGVRPGSRGLGLLSPYGERELERVRGLLSVEGRSPLSWRSGLKFWESVCRIGRQVEVGGPGDGVGPVSEGCFGDEERL